MIKICGSLSLPDDVATQTTAVLGIRGSGKTNTSVCITEGLLAKQTQVIVIDPTDVWWGLKSSQNGKAAGFPIVVLGGPHGDLPLAAESGVLVADFAVEHRASLILSLRHLRKHAQKQLVTAFAEQLYHRKGEAGNRTPVLVVIDECDAFIPQRVGGAETRMVGAIEDLVRRGRAAGLGVLLISQRAASINKDVLTQIELLVAHRHTSPQDRKALEAWIEAHDTGDHHAEFMASLASLRQGEAWFWSPGWIDIFKRVQVRQRDTFDSSKTPDAGGTAAVPTKQAVVDLGKLQLQLKASIDEAKANDPKTLKARIAELEKQLAKPAPRAEPQLTEKDLRRLELQVERFVGAAEMVQSVSLDAHALIGELSGKLKANAQPRPITRQPTPSKPKSAPPRTAASTTVAGMTLGKAERSILGAFYWLKDEEATKAKVAFYSGYAANSGSFNSALGKLRTTGLLQGWNISLAGCDAVADVTGPKPSGNQLREWLRPKLSKAENQLLDALIAVYPQRLSNAELSAASGYAANSGSFNNSLGRLRTIEAAEGYERDGGVKASYLFFA